MSIYSTLSLKLYIYPKYKLNINRIAPFEMTKMIVGNYLKAGEKGCLNYLAEMKQKIWS